MPRPLEALSVDQYQALLVGLPKLYATAKFNYGEVEYTTDEVVTLIATILATRLAVAPAKAAWLAAIQAARTSEEVDGEIVKAVRDIVALRAAKAPATLAELGIKSRKVRATLTAEQRLAAKAKAAATRKARGTMGKRQKARIKGDVTGVTITPFMTGEPKEG